MHLWEYIKVRQEKINYDAEKSSDNRTGCASEYEEALSASYNDSTEFVDFFCIICREILFRRRLGSVLEHLLTFLLTSSK